MTMRFQPQNMNLFSLVGSIHKKYALPMSTRQKLGFLLLAAIDDFIEMLVRSTFYEESELIDAKMSVDDTLDFLRSQEGSRFEHLTRNQALVMIIEEEFFLINDQIEKEVKQKHKDRLIRESVRELFLHAFNSIDYPDGE